MRDYKFSYFFDKVKGVKCVEPTKVVSIHDIYNLVRTNQSLKDITEKYRETQDKIWKEKLPFFTPAGIFKKKSDAQFMEHTSDTYNWLIPFDIDRKDNTHITNWEDLFVNKISCDPSVLIAFVSPSGGIKGLIVGKEGEWNWKRGEKISVHATIMKERFYPNMEKSWGVKLDPAQAVLSQSMFLCHDPYVHFNPDATPLSPNVTISTAIAIQNIGDNVFMEDLISLDNYLNILETTKENKWQKLSGIFYFIARCAAGKVISSEPEKIKEALLKAFHANKHIEDHKTGEAKMLRSWEEGMKLPIPIQQFVSKKALDELRKMVKDYMLDENFENWIRIGVDYFSREKRIDEKSGIVSEVLIPSSRSSFFDDFGKDAHHRIKKVYGFCNVPGYFAKDRIVNGAYNLWPALPYTPAPGVVDNSLYMISHIADGDQRIMDILLDYLHLAMFRPKQLLPIIALVSKTQGTGKSTFLEWLEKIFAGNAIIMESSKFEDTFNMAYATKHFIMIDEGEYRNDKKGIANKMKKWATQKSVLVNEKFMKPTYVDYYGRIIIASNQEDSFIKIEDDDVRYFVLRVPMFDQSKKSSTFVSTLMDEIPAFVHWLKERGLKKKTSNGERFWFSPEELATPWLHKIRKATKDELVWTIMIKCKDWFDTQSASKEFLQTTKSDFKDFLDMGHNVQLKYVTQTLEKIGAEIDEATTRGINDLQSSYTTTTGTWIRISRRTVEDFFLSAGIKPSSGGILTPKKLL